MKGGWGGYRLHGDLQGDLPGLAEQASVTTRV